jgi:hypothetical protein
MIMDNQSQSGIEAHLTRLGSMDRADLTAAWTDCYGSTPPPKISQQLMIKAIAYRWQEEVFGELSGIAQRMLCKIACGGSGGSMPSLAPAAAIKPGTRFVREWQGRRIEVTADMDGKFSWEGGTYPSLSAIARKVTNTRRNGPAFFGLRGG